MTKLEVGWGRMVDRKQLLSLVSFSKNGIFYQFLKGVTFYMKGVTIMTRKGKQ